VFKEFGEASDDWRRSATNRLAPPLAPEAARDGACQELFLIAPQNFRLFEGITLQ